jgi:glycosyltransferase involved in cell wall biosynthesis
VARDQQIVRLDQILAARTDEAATLRQLVASRDRQLAEADQAIVDYRKQVDPLRGELAQLMRQTDALRVREAEKDAKLKSFEVAVVAIHRSTSWRMTSPLRAVGMILRRLYYSRFGYPLALARCFLTTRAPVRDWLAVHTVARSSLFDREWYSKTYPDVAARGIDPVRHYIASGAREGRDPSLHFSTRSYLSQNPDVAAAGINPLFHYIRYGAAEGRAGRSSLPTPPIESPANSTLRVSGAKTPPFEQKRSDARGSEEVGGSHEALAADCKLLRDSGIFDDAAYRAAARIAPEADAVEHYLLEGWHVGFEPGPDYDGASLYPYYRSVGYIGAPAITHLKLRASGAPAYASLEDAEHWAAAIRGSDLFNAAEYAARLDLAEELDPGLHYVVVGEHMGYPPSDAFDSKYYRERYPDIARSGINAFAHYVGYGRHEGRRPASIADKLAMDRSRLDARRETVLLVVHEASRTGAPILAWNIAVQLRHRYNVVALFIRGGELLGNFEDCCAAVVGPVGDPDWQPIEGEYIVRRLLDSYSITYAIANSIVSRLLVPALAGAFVPVVSLIHEFASYTRPKEVMREGLDWSTQVVFSSDVTAESAKSEHPHLVNRTIHVRPQGRCEVPRATKAVFSAATPNLREVFRPSGWEDALVVLGAGFVHIRKGVDLFLACAAAVSALNLKRPVRFIWIGSGYDLVDDPGYSAYLAEQIARSGLEGIVAIVDAVEDLEPAYAMSDVFFLSSRLDPLPNVTIDAAYHGLPIVCFDKASGMAALLSEEILLRSCVVPHLNVDAAAHVIAQFANDEKMRAETGNAIRRFAETNFDMERYVNRLDELGRSSIPVMRQRAEDFTTIRDDPLFDDDVFRQPNEKISSRDHAIMEFLTLWAAVGCGKAGVRRPAAGFHPQIYAHENSDRYDIAAINPLAHFLRSGKPKGPWLNDIITPPCEVKQREIGEANSARLRVGIHAHFYYPELITEFLSKVSCNRLPCDLLLTTDDFEKADNLRDAAAQYCRGEVIIRIVPNRGRDFGPLLTALAKDVTERYDVIGHFHGKRSFAVDGAMGEIWREFLWQNLIGERHPMMDVIVERFSRDAKLGLVFPSDPYLCGWDDNRAIADDLAKRIGIKASLPDFFDFPVGTMFWARVDALKPLFDLQVGWKDYPKEPLPIDGTTLHALERLLPFVVRHTGYRFATTHVPGVTR